MAEILPHESADMYYYTVNGELCKTPNVIESEDDLHVDDKSIPCWSFAALLYVIPKLATHDVIDACYDLILSLHKENRL